MIVCGRDLVGGTALDRVWCAREGKRGINFYLLLDNGDCQVSGGYLQSNE